MSLRLPFTDLDGMIDAGYKLAVLDDSALMETFSKASKDTAYHRVWQYTAGSEEGLVGDQETGLELILREDFAYYDNYLSISGFREFLDCDIVDTG